MMRMRMMSDFWKTCSNAETTTSQLLLLLFARIRTTGTSDLSQGQCPERASSVPGLRKYHQLTIDSRETIRVASSTQGPPANGNVKVDSLPQTPQILDDFGVAGRADDFNERIFCFGLESSYENSRSMISSIYLHIIS